MMDIAVQRFTKGYILGYKKYARSKIYRRLARFIDSEYHDVVGHARKLVCPFCYRRFSARIGLVKHLHGGRCGKEFASLIIEVVESYRRFRSSSIGS